MQATTSTNQATSTVARASLCTCVSMQCLRLQCLRCASGFILQVCCMHLCSSFRTADGVLGVCRAMALYWNGEYFCQLFAERHLHIEDSDGTGHGRPGLKAETLKKSAKAMQKTMCDTAPSTQECATVISGCHVKWATSTVLNKGYIMEASWDSSVGRRAGGYDN